MKFAPRLRASALASAALAALTMLPATVLAVQLQDPAFDHVNGHFGSHNVKPRFIAGAISARQYAAGACPVVGIWCGEAGDDLLTGGLGKTGLALRAPTYANALAPTAVELTATPSTPTTVPCSTSWPPAAMAGCTAPT